jgi:HSP20 family protein
MNGEMTRTGTRRETAEMAPFGRLFDEWFGFGRMPTALLADVDRLIKPALNVVEGEHAFTITCELPGVAKDDVSITIEDGVLTIAGEKKREEEHKDKSWHRIERAYGSFQRQMTLPKGVDGDRADASFKDGVLTIELPKTEQAKPKTLKVK